MHGHEFVQKCPQDPAAARGQDHCAEAEFIAGKTTEKSVDSSHRSRWSNTKMSGVETSTKSMHEYTFTVQEILGVYVLRKTRERT